MRRWRVENSIRVDAAPVEAWAAAVRELASEDPSIEDARVVALCEPDEIDPALRSSTLVVDVVVEASDRVAAAAYVESLVMPKLWELVKDRELGWTAYEWVAVPADA